MDKLKVMSLTLEEIEEAVKMRDALLNEAIAAEALIREVYHNFEFNPGEERIEVWTDDRNCEYITDTGVWQARYLHRSYDVPCTVDGIFEVLKGGYFATYGPDSTPAIKENAQRCSYFKWFLERAKGLKETESKTPFEG